MLETFDWPWVETQSQKTAELWRASAGRLSPHQPCFNTYEQQRREQAYDKAMHRVEDEARRKPRSESEREAAQSRMTSSFAEFAAVALDLEDSAIHLLTDEMLPVGTTLAQWARDFDPTLSKEDMTQACRNAWTACGLQPLLGEAIGLNASILGYSLLYPYTDNYLDNPKISHRDKHAFGDRFQSRLAGDVTGPANEREWPLWELVRLIEDQYPRGLHPQVYQAILAIHRAQQQSVRQLYSFDEDRRADVLHLSCAKGGSSVLVDACLARGHLTPQESRFAFEWGVLLQLGDDLQDVREDLRRGSATLFSLAASTGLPLDFLASQLFQFGDRVTQHMEELPLGAAMLRNLLKSSWKSLIVQAIADSREFFTSEYLREMENRSPFRFQFLRSRRRRMTRRRGLYESLFDRFLDAPRTGFGPLPSPVVRTSDLGYAGS